MSLTHAEKLHRSERVAAAALMAQTEGCSISAAARAFGVHSSAVWRRLNPERYAQHRVNENARKRRRREWDESHRLPCPRCGTPMRQGSARADATPSSKACELCITCARAARGESNRLIVAMWNEGMKRGEIADALGLAPQGVTVRIAQLRAKGYDLPYRRPDAIDSARHATNIRLGRVA